MTLNSEKEIEQTWGSHKPLLRAVMEILRPESVVECGCGKYSTPIIEQTAKKIITIEHDTIWASKIIKQYTDHLNHHWLIQALPNAHNGIRRSAMKDVDLAWVDNYYAKLNLEPCDFLFVDSFACARVPAMLHLTDGAQMVLLHDLERNSPEFYSYHLIGNKMKGWWRYRYAPLGMISKEHVIPWTDLFARQELSSEELLKMQVVIDAEADRLWGFSAKLVDITSIAEGWGNN